MTHYPKKRFGQHFLHDGNIIRKIISHMGLRENDHIIEIGPGLGALTKPLLQATGELHVIELDHDLIPQLQQNCAGHGTLHIHQADALRFDINSLAQASKPMRLVGNLPYNISTPLLFHLLKFSSNIHDMHFMLQKEVVDRMTAEPDTSDYGRLSVMLQIHCQIIGLFDVPPGCFIPPPKVMSSIVRLIPYTQPCHPIGNPAMFANIVRLAFAQRRKTMRNCMKPIATAEQLETFGIDPGCRGETLTLEQFARLSVQLSARQPA